MQNCFAVHNGNIMPPNLQTTLVPNEKIKKVIVINILQCLMIHEGAKEVPIY